MITVLIRYVIPAGRKIPIAGASEMEGEREQIRKERGMEGEKKKKKER